MRFSPYNEARVPNIVVDGSRNDDTLLTLSHWPKSGTPRELKADTSAEIAFNYVDSPEFHVQADVVTNNHFDQDGLVAVFVLLDPVTASRYRDLLIDVASAGDFGVFKSRDAARINFAVSSLSETETSPFPQHIFALPYPRMAAELYIRILDLFPRLIAEPDNFKSLWESEDARLAESEELVNNGTVTIEEQPDLDLAAVQIPESSTASACHPLAIYNATPCTRILQTRGQHVEFQYRYESWVQLVSRKPALRVDLSAVAAGLTAEENGAGQWKFDGVDAITPRLHRVGGRDSSIRPEAVRRRIEQQLRSAPPAWDPYDAS